MFADQKISRPVGYVIVIVVDGPSSLEVISLMNLTKLFCPQDMILSTRIPKVNIYLYSNILLLYNMSFS
jgi:hypothetical protein